MSSIQQMYERHCKTNSDINEHLHILKKYAEECSHIVECGVCGACSSYAFAEGLRGRVNTTLIQYDINYNDKIGEFINNCKTENINNIFYLESDIKCKRQQTDLLFIDTWHVYGQLKRELEYWNTYVHKYIIMHDTTVDEWEGETIRSNMDYNKQSAETGIPVDEIMKGLWPAIDEFLLLHPEWVLHERYINNNGLTILKRQ
jgi:hypothetical protein